MWYFTLHTQTASKLRNLEGELYVGRTVRKDAGRPHRRMYWTDARRGTSSARTYICIRQANDKCNWDMCVFSWRCAYLPRMYDRGGGSLGTCGPGQTRCVLDILSCWIRVFIAQHRGKYFGPILFMLRPALQSKYIRSSPPGTDRTPLQSFTVT